jgi:uncharacterized protein DUF5372
VAVEKEVTHDAEPGAVISQNWPCRTSAVSATSDSSPEPPPAHLDKLSTTPDNTDGEPCFTITYPFHPLCGRTFPLLSQRLAWGEERVFFPDPETHLTPADYIPNFRPN